MSGGSRTLVLTGEVDLLMAPALQEEIERLCAEQPSEIVLDLGNVTFMDSTGLRATISVYELCKAGGHRFSVIPGPRQVQSLFELTGLADVLPFQGEGERLVRSDEAILPRLFMPEDTSAGEAG